MMRPADKGFMTEKRLDRLGAPGQAFPFCLLRI
jgi:hypothetical protein